MYFLEQGEDECDPLIWCFIQGQEDEMSSELEPILPECYIYFVRHILFIFQSALFSIEGDNVISMEVYNVMTGLHEKLISRKNNKSCFPPTK